MNDPAMGAIYIIRVFSASEYRTVSQTEAISHCRGQSRTKLGVRAKRGPPRHSTSIPRMRQPIAMRSSTVVTPGADHAARSAALRSDQAAQP
jgi:hypothetical protein